MIRPIISIISGLLILLAGYLYQKSKKMKSNSNQAMEKNQALEKKKIKMQDTAFWIALPNVLIFLGSLFY